MRGAIVAAAVVLFFGHSVAYGQAPSQWGRLQPGPYAVGFRSILAKDAGRALQANGSKADPRPVQISVWYPAQSTNKRPRMPYFFYFFMDDPQRTLSQWSKAELEQKLSERVQRAVQQGAREASAIAYYRAATFVTRDAPRAKGTFPLLVFSPSMLASPLTNTVMCEYLASQGYVVAAHPSFGIAPRFMTTTLDGLETQARDVEFVVATLASTDPQVDGSRVGVLGHSWGGIAGLLAAARNPRIGAVTSLDGSEEMWRDLLSDHPEFVSTQFVTPYLRMTKPKAATNPDRGLFDSIKYAPTIRVILDSSIDHFEFVSNVMVSSQATHRPGLEESQNAFAMVSTTTWKFFDAFLCGQAKTLDVWQTEAVTRLVKGKPVVVQRGPALAPPPSDAAFMALITDKGWGAAKDVYLRWIEQDPETFSSARLVRIGEMLLWTGRNNEAALAVLELAKTRTPTLARAHEMIGNVYFWILGESAKALPYYREALRLDPNSPQVKIYLEQIEGIQK